GFGWAAYHLEKKPEPEKPKQSPASDGNKKTIDSLKRTIDSLLVIVNLPPAKMGKKKNIGDEEEIDNGELIIDNYEDAEGDESAAATATDGTDLVLRNLLTGEEKTFPLVSEYYFDKYGKKLLLETTRNSKDSLSKSSVVLIDLGNMQKKTISTGGNDFKNFSFSEDGSQLAFVAERNAKPKDLQKFYKLWYYKEGMDTASMIADKNSVGMKIGMTVSEFGTTSFSKSGKRLFFGTAPIQPPRDTTLVDFETAKLDIWNYKDDYLQTVQLNRLQRDLQENFLAIYDITKNTIKQLGSRELPTVYLTNEGDGETFVGVTDFGKRIEGQWTGNTLKDVYAINVADGSKKLVIKDLNGFISPQYISPTGKYIMWYDRKAKNYFAYDGKETRNITSKIKVPLYDEEYDNPDYPPPHGIMGWHEGDSAVYIYDRYDAWKIDPTSKIQPQNFYGLLSGRKDKIVTRYISTDPEKKFIKSDDILLVRRFSEITKQSILTPLWAMMPPELKGYSYSQPIKAKNSNVLIYTRENFKEPADIYLVSDPAICYDCPSYNNATEGSRKQGLGGASAVLIDTKLSSINPQQKDYNWGTAELIKWKAYNGKETQGIVYKPEDFDPKKKYPLICYFYEALSDGLYTYHPPSPTPSRLNISFFVSRGYVVLAPDIHYGTGHPARDAYNHIVSGARYLVKQGYIDSTRMGLQGQSWGGIQVAQLITMTKIFKAAWAGAPVANMTSAYGGIRWESGVNRQFQYEKSQSRIGATLWEKPNLYIENSPL
ncbi:MAG TPA: prolyl oligopeptidase family serine peptidase, partial [Chitinophagaceae bacterium]|nr:prolyl oligopeptidase family serine peptidase [Chitinophagaceae bacterium]